MRVSDSTVERVRQYHDIVSYMSHYVTLKRRGKNHIGLCPFHSEKTPSFTVSAERHLWHCFGCHESGDLISFVQKMDNLTFTESIVRIAETVGIPVDYDSTSSNPYADERDVLRDIVVAFRDYCKSQLTSQHDAYHYLIDRGVSPESITVFQLGFASRDFQPLEFCKQHKFEPAQLLKSGLVFRADDGAYVSRFRNRLLFPIFDHLGKVAGFSGRILDKDSKAAKYVNSEENALFNKRKLLFGIDRAKSAIKLKKSVLIVEGYMDVLMCHQHGFGHAVGIMGTALTTEQVQLLKRFTETVYLALDSDASGQQAIEKSYHVLRQFGLQSYVVKMDQKDPADMLRDGNVEGFELLLQQAIPAMEFMFEQAIKRHGTDRIEMVSKILQDIRPLLQGEKDLVVRKHYVNLISQRLGVDESLILVNRAAPVFQDSNKSHFNKQVKRSRIELAEEQLLFFLYCHFELRSQVSEWLGLDDFEKEEHRLLVREILQSNFENKELLESLENNTLKNVLTQIVMRCDQFDMVTKSSNIWRECVDVILQAKREKQIVLLKDEILRLETKGGEEKRIGDLLRELQELKSSKRGSI